MNINKRLSGYYLAFKSVMLILLVTISCSTETDKKISILATTDLHGLLLHYDYIEKRAPSASLANVSTYVKEVRRNNSSVVLLDNGDNLQGQPQVYYYNFIDTTSPHLISEVMNYMRYDAVTVGNHDIEAGHPVYDRLAGEYNFPMLAANAVNVSDKKPYFKPYTIIERGGVRVAVMGLITPAVPNWLPPELYRGMIFEDMKESAEKWMPVILREKPDVVVGLFHSGWDTTGNDSLSFENGSMSVAFNVPGFHVIFNGHDHNVANEKFVNKRGDTILILNGGSRAEKVARADVTVRSRKSGTRIITAAGTIINSSGYEPDPEFAELFSARHKALNEYVSRVIARSSEDISSRDSYFGPSAFVDLIHTVQLDISGADLSFSAPLSFDVRINRGDVTIADMFKLYRYENMLYTMELTGAEIRKYLEYSYSLWLNTMQGPGDLLLKLRVDNEGKPVLVNGKAWLLNFPYNFDSAAGIVYEVDASKPEGERVLINSFTDGRPFEELGRYRVALNSYRGNGGGGHLESGAGLSRDQMRERLINSTEKDLRYYIMNYLEENNKIDPVPLNNWKIVPVKWVKPAAEREKELLFGKTK